MSSAPRDDSKKYPELAFGLIGPLGTDLSLVARHLRDALSNVGYQSEVLRLSRLMREIPEKPWSSLQDEARDREIENHIKAGNSLRRVLGRNDAVALLGLGAMREYRDSQSGEPNRSIPAFAAIFHSLKTPEEIETLRSIYGPAFFVLAAYSPRGRRVRDLASRIAETHYENKLDAYLAAAERLISIDEQEVDDPHGQNVRKAFSLADVIVDATANHSLQGEVLRFIELLFGNSFHTPSRDEQGMFLARSAAVRSASLARQVGAVICRKDGSVVAIGSNEVARFGGGQYWPDDVPDGRDFRMGYDSSDRMRENLLGDVLSRLKQSGWLSAHLSDIPLKELVEKALRSGELPAIEGAQFNATIDYVRAVHAEMAAITDASLHGVSTSGCEMFTTTFPCHNCAKHIVAAGISRVVYVEPYPKSLVGELFTDSIAIDSDSDDGKKVRMNPFVGVAPARYGELFALRKRRRKHIDGSVAVWRALDSSPQMPEYLPSGLVRLTAEEEAFKKFQGDLQSKGLAGRKAHDS